MRSRPSSSLSIAAMVAVSLCLSTPAPDSQAAPRKSRATPAHRHSSQPAASRPRAPAPISQDSAFANARRAFLSQDRSALDQAARQAAGHPLAEYLPYWRMTLALRASTGTGTGSAELDDEVAQFVTEQPNRLVANLLRKEWIRSLARRERWSQVREQADKSAWDDDNTINCLAWTADLALDDTLPPAARDSLMQPRELGEGCNGLMLRAFSAGKLTTADMLRRVRLSAEAGASATGRRAVTALNRDGNEMEAAWRDPVRLLDQGPHDDEAIAVALALLARTDAAEAAQRLTRLTRLDHDARLFAWAVIGAQAAQQMLPQAAGWVRQGLAAQVSDDTRGWMARAALAANDFSLLHKVLAPMSADGLKDPTWAYWLARAEQAAGHPAKAAGLYRGIAGQLNFYGQLAAEELGHAMPLPAANTPLSADETGAAAANPGFVRAMQFYEQGMRIEGNREWNFQLRDMSDRQLIAAADLACRKAILDRCVNTAARTRTEHSFAMRFLAPYRERLAGFAAAHGLDPAWVYGVIRQESRFYTDARSHAGAQGLMQVMPATGEWIARQLGLTGYRREQLQELDTNLKFGTFYLRDVIDRLGQSEVLASAGYNAGPGRPARWRQVLSGIVDGAAFAEIIPFAETRDYVKKVMWNTHWYASLFTGRPQSLKRRMGTVTPRPDPTQAKDAAIASPAAALSVPAASPTPEPPPVAAPAPAASLDETPAPDAAVPSTPVPPVTLPPVSVESPDEGGESASLLDNAE